MSCDTCVIQRGGVHSAGSADLTSGVPRAVLGLAGRATFLHPLQSHSLPSGHEVLYTVQAGLSSRASSSSSLLSWLFSHASWPPSANWLSRLEGMDLLRACVGCIVTVLCHSRSLGKERSWFGGLAFLSCQPGVFPEISFQLEAHTASLLPGSIASARRPVCSCQEGAMSPSSQTQSPGDFFPETQWPGRSSPHIHCLGAGRPYLLME